MWHRRDPPIRNVDLQVTFQVFRRVARFFLTQYIKTRENIPNNHNIAKWPKDIPNDRKIFSMAIKYTSIFQSKVLQNLPKMGFLVWKQTIWQPWSSDGCFYNSPVDRPNDAPIGLPRVARWHIFKLKIQIWENFGEVWKGKCCYILCPFGTYYGHLVYFKAIVIHILWPFGY
jgi:hypothetical protein